MTQIIRNSILILATLVFWPLSANADWKTFWRDVHIGFHRNNDWPKPFHEADVNEVKKPFEIMKSNGWRLHNTIGNDLFQSGDGGLLSAGQRKLHWIATQAPETRRQVFVMRAKTLEETQARIQAVQSVIDSYGADLPAPEIYVTETAPPTVSGSWATKINREWMDHMTAPKLPDQSTTGQPGVSSSSGSR